MTFSASATKTQKLLNEIAERSNENVIILKTESVSDPVPKMNLVCKVCKEKAVWQYNFDNPYGIELGFVESFCNTHKHSAATQTDQTFENATKVKKGDAVSFDGNTYNVTETEVSQMIMNPAMAGEAAGLFGSLAAPLLIPADTFLTAQKVKETTEHLTGMMGDIHFHDGGRTSSSVSVSQELLKWIARLSNFNVNLQARVAGTRCTDYRAICDRCGKFKPMLYEYMISKDAMKPESELSKFCREHSHDGSDRIEPKGRKFRHADSESQ